MTKKKKSLIETNPHLKDPVKRAALIKRSVESSCRVEGIIPDPDFVMPDIVRRPKRLDNLTDKQKRDLVDTTEALEKYKRENVIESFFPDEGPFRREFYPKHVAFFDAGAVHKERAFIAGNRVGKSISGAFELALHLTGQYPEWWKGKRFDEPTKCWAAGMTNETTRDIIQREMLGKRGEYGTGMIPKKYLMRTTSRPGVPDAVQDVFVKHASGGTSELGFKSYVQGVESFMGTSRHVVWFDEEMDNTNIYSEALTRTMTTGGIIFCTFTPLKGLSDVVLSFLPGGKMPTDGIVPDDWQEAEGHE